MWAIGLGDVGELSVESGRGQGTWVDGAQSSRAFTLAEHPGWGGGPEAEGKQSLLVCRVAARVRDPAGEMQ